MGGAKQDRGCESRVGWAELIGFNQCGRCVSRVRLWRQGLDH